MEYEKGSHGWINLMESYRTEAKRYKLALKTIRKISKLQNDDTIVDFITNVLEG